MTNSFQRATRKASRLRIGLESPSGGGKTYTSLVIATELAAHDGGRIAVIDSERGSSSKYSDGRPFEFDMAMLPDTNPLTYVQTLREAATAHYPVVVVDSASHEWKGVLGIVDRATPSMGGNSWSAWSKARPAHDVFVEMIMAMPAHVVATFRSKQETEQYKDSDNRTKVRKLGLSPVTSDDMDFEFDLWGSIDHETHTVIITKSRLDTVPVGSEWPEGRGIAAAYLEWLGGAEYEAPEALPESARSPVPMQPRNPVAGSVDAPDGLMEERDALLKWAFEEHGLAVPQVVEILNGITPEQFNRMTHAGIERARTTILEKLGTPPVTLEIPNA